MLQCVLSALYDMDHCLSAVQLLIFLSMTLYSHSGVLPIYLFTLVLDIQKHCFLFLTTISILMIDVLITLIIILTVSMLMAWEKKNQGIGKPSEVTSGLPIGGSVLTEPYVCNNNNNKKLSMIFKNINLDLVEWLVEEMEVFRNWRSKSYFPLW